MYRCLLSRRNLCLYPWYEDDNFEVPQTHLMISDLLTKTTQSIPSFLRPFRLSIFKITRILLQVLTSQSPTIQYSWTWQNICCTSQNSDKCKTALRVCSLDRLDWSIPFGCTSSSQSEASLDIVKHLLHIAEISGCCINCCSCAAVLQRQLDHLRRVSSECNYCLRYNATILAANQRPGLGFWIFCCTS